MNFEQDYIMRMIKQMVAALVKILFGKESTVCEMPLEEQYQVSDGVLRDLLTMVNDGNINEAENLLYEKFDFKNEQDMKDAVLFYMYLNNFEDDYLESYNYSREEIKSGLNDILKLSGMEWFTKMFE